MSTFHASSPYYCYVRRGQVRSRAFPFSVHSRLQSPVTEPYHALHYTLTGRVGLTYPRIEFPDRGPWHQTFRRTYWMRLIYAQDCAALWLQF